MDDWKDKQKKIFETLLGLSFILAIIVIIFTYIDAWDNNHGFKGLFTAPLTGVMFFVMFALFSFVMSYVIPLSTAMIHKYQRQSQLKKLEEASIQGKKLAEQRYYTSLEPSSIKDVEALKKYKSYNKNVKVEEILFEINLENQEILDFLFSTSININHVDENGNTILHKAAKNNNTAAIEFFLDKGAKIERENKNKETPLLFAALNLQKASVKLLIEKAAKFDIKEPKHIENITKTLFANTYKDLFGAVSKGDESAIGFFLDNGADLYAKDSLKRNVLEIAAAEGQKKLVGHFLKNKKLEFDINDITTVENITGLIFRTKYKNLLEATQGKNLEAVEFLLENGADVSMSNENGQTSLSISAGQGFIEGTKKLLEYKSDIDTKDKYGFTALTDAITYAHLDVVKLLLSNGADTKVLDNNENNLLHKASLSLDRKTLAYILELGLDIESTNVKNQTALNFASAVYKGSSSHNQHKKIITSLLLTHGAQLDITDKTFVKNLTETMFGKEYISILAATVGNNLEAVELFLDNGADIEMTENQSTPLILAVRNGFTDLVKELINKGANDKILDKNKQTMLHLSAAYSHKDLVNFFLDRGQTFDINNEKDIENLTNTLFNGAYKNVAIAASNNDIKAIEFLLANGADIEAVNEEDYTGLMLAVRKGYSSLVQDLLNKDVDDKLLDKRVCISLEGGLYNEQKDLPIIEGGNTLLHVAAYNNRKDLVELFLERGQTFDINNTQDVQNITKSLFNGAYKNIADASENNDLKAIEFLLSNGADIESVNDNGYTGLMLAVINGHTSLVIELLSKGANDTLLETRVCIRMEGELYNADKDLPIIESGNTLLHLAAYNNRRDLVELFLERGQTFDINNTENVQNITNTLFNTAYKNIADASENNDLKAIEFLLARGGDIESVDDNSNSALIVATKNNNFDIVSFLLKNGVSKQSKDLNSNTALVWAAYMGYTKILDLLSDKDSLFHKVIDTIELSGYEKINLAISDIFVNQLGALLTYKTEYKDHFDWTTKLDEVKKILQLKDIKLIDNHNNEYLIQVYGNSNEAKMIKSLLVNSKRPEFVKIDLDEYRTYIFFKNISGTTLEHWNEQKTYIEDELEMPVEIEEYDQSHTLYPKYGKEKLILIIESLISVMPGLLGIGGKYLKTVNEDGFNVSYFVNIEDTSKWNDAKDKIIELIGKRINIVEDSTTVKLVETIEVAIPKLLDLIDTNKRYSELYHVKEDGANKLYFYTFLPELDLNVWKEKSRKTNFRTLFNEPDKVYKLDIYDKTNEELYDASFYTGQLIVLKEFAKIPTKEEAGNHFSLNELEENKIFWGYGSSSKKYYTGINEFQNMMIIGSAGSGKSNFINGALLSLLNSAHLIKKMYLIDLKSGIEFTKYQDLESEKVDVFGRGTKPSKLLEALREVEVEMYLREEYLVSNKLAKIEDNPIFVIIDEFAQINLMNAQGDEAKAKEEINNILIRLGTRARSANIKLIVQTQDPKSVGDELKAHLQSRALLKTGKDFDKDHTLINPEMMEEQGIKHTKFDKGRFVFENYNDGDTEFVELQFPFIDPNDELHKNYITKAQTDTDLDDSIFDEFKDYVRSEYPYLANTKLLAIEEEEASESVQTDVVVETHEVDEFDFDSFLDDDEASKDQEEDFTEVNELYSGSLDILNELKGNN